MYSPNPNNAATRWRRAAPVFLLLQAGLLAAELWQMAHHEPDAYRHQHLRLLMGSLSGCSLTLAVWIEQPRAKNWLLVLTVALLAASVMVRVA